MGAQPGDITLTADIIDGIDEDVDLAVAHAPVRAVALNLQNVGAVINGVIDRLARLFFCRMHLADDLQRAVVNAAVFVDQRQLDAGDVHGVDARLFAELQRFKYLSIRVIGFEQGGHINEIARMRPAADEVAAHDHAADVKILDFAFGQFAFQILQFCVAQFDGRAGDGVDFFPSDFIHRGINKAAENGQGGQAF